MLRRGVSGDSVGGSVGACVCSGVHYVPSCHTCMPLSGVFSFFFTFVYRSPPRQPAQHSVSNPRPRRVFYPIFPPQYDCLFFKIYFSVNKITLNWYLVLSSFWKTICVPFIVKRLWVPRTLYPGWHRLLGLPHHLPQKVMSI